MTTDTSTTDILRFAAVGLLLAWALWKNHRNRRYRPQRLEDLATSLQGTVVKGWFRPFVHGTCNGRSIVLRWPPWWGNNVQQMVVTFGYSGTIRGKVRPGRAMDDLRRLGADETRLGLETTRSIVEIFSMQNAGSLIFGDGKATLSMRRDFDEADLQELDVTFALTMVEAVVGVVERTSPSGRATT
jgi:hypothetical protein